jgi:small subunit ribosomal protein S2
MKFQISLDELIRSGAHFGHQTKRWNPKMGQYLYGEKEGVHIFDLEKTAKLLQETLDFLSTSSKEGKTFLFLGTKKQAKDIVRKVAQECNSFYVNERFLGGTFTNFEQIRRSADKLVDMKRKFEEGFYNSFTKKERLLLEREVSRLERYFGGIVGIKKVPDVLIVVDVRREYQAVREARRVGVTTVALVDSNCDPTQIDYPIPMNDDATKAIDYVLGLMARAINEGRTKPELSKTRTNSSKKLEKEKKDVNLDLGAVKKAEVKGKPKPKNSSKKEKKAQKKPKS